MPTSEKNESRITGRRTILVLITAGSLSLLGACLLAQVLDPFATIPVDTGAHEKLSNLYQNPQPVHIDGYDDDCMEPFITGDGKYLLFNNSNSALVNTHIHLCKRMGSNHFQHVGLLPGSVSQSKDMAPSIDADGHLYFTCLRSFEEDGHSIYYGEFALGSLKNIKLPNGDISPHKPAEINMDCDISKDGKTLVLSRAHFANYLLPPDKSDLALAEKKNETFVLAPERQIVFSKINTSALEYAPCQSTDQLELFFTRASRVAVAASEKKLYPYFRIMVARRKDCFSPYGEPENLAQLTGFIEAPTITDDKKEMFFHKKVGDNFRIFCAKRRADER